MSGIAKARKVHYVTVDILSLRSLVLALFLALGIAIGYALSGRYTAGSAAEELDLYFRNYLAGSAEAPRTAEAVCKTLVCYLRGPMLVFLFGFASLGVVLIPILFVAQGFVLSFSLFSFAFAIGREAFWMLPVLFGLRMLFVLPCTLFLGSAAMEKSLTLMALSLGGGKRARPITYELRYWYRLIACILSLCIGCVLELWLAPLLLAGKGF